MTSLFFTNTLMLAGMAALAIPILVHLLLKRRKKQIQFSTLRFFQQQDFCQILFRIKLAALAGHVVKLLIQPGALRPYIGGAEKV